MKYFILLLTFVFNFSNATEYEELFSFDMNKDFLKYEEYLKKPSIIYKYLSYNNLYIASFANVNLKNNKELNIGIGTLKFINKDKNIYYYDLRLAGIGHKSAKVKLIIDHENLKSHASVSSSLYSFIPKLLIQRSYKKLSDVFSIDNQLYLFNLIENDLINYENIEDFLIFNSNNFILTKKDNDLAISYYIFYIWLIILFIFIFLKRSKLKK